MKYVHSLLTIPHHQLKINRKFNINFNLNMKYARVRSRPKTLNFDIPTPLVTYHFSSTASASSALPSLFYLPFLMPFILLTDSGILKRLERKVGDNMHHKQMFSEIQNKNGYSTENIENFVINLCSFYSTQSTKKLQVGHS